MVESGRVTAAGDDDVTVFLIGMRLNQLHRIDKWLPIFMAMPRMIKHLMQHREVGMLSYDMWFGRTTLLLSYWKSPEHLQRFAADGEAPHLQPWRDFNRRVGTSGVVGIWHETYRVPASNREVIYVNMPRFGLGKALGIEPIGQGTATAKQRMRHWPVVVDDSGQGHAETADGTTTGTCPVPHD